jgi:hypothetical protein
MADDKKKIVEQFSSELDVLQDKLNNLASFLGASMRNKLSDLTTDASNFVEQFERGEDITKKLNTKLTSVQKDINKLSLNRIKLESDLSRVQQLGLIGAEQKIKAALLQNKLATQQTESAQTLLIKLQQAAEEEKKITEEKKKQNSLTEQAKKLYTDAIKPLKELFTIAGILKAIVDGALQFNKTSVEISKNLGYAGNEADNVVESMQYMAATTSNINVTLKSLTQAMGELNAATGGVAEYSADALETQVMLTKQFGLTGEEAAGIYKFSVLTGKASSQVNKEMVAAFASTRNMVRGSANFKTTMAEASKVSGQLAANFRNNPAEITKAVVQAQALGTTLEKAKSQGEKLLNFEESIEAELKAELLTGQQLNLERARAAALQGDQVTVMKELANQGMTLEKFQGMNVVAQKSFAEALGLSADELSNQLNQQKIAQEQGKSLAQVQAEDLEAAQKRQNVQDRFNALVEKLMDMIGKIGILLNPFFRAFEAITDNAFALYGILGVIALTRLPAIAKFFKGIGSDIKDAAKNATKLFSKEGRADIFGGGAKKPEIPATPEAGKAGKGMGGFMDSLKGIKTTDMIKAAAAILILAGALFVAAKSFQEFANVSWEDMAKAGVALVGLATVAAIIGSPMIVGFVEAGAFALGSLGLALIPFALAARIATPAIQAFGDVLTKAFTGLGTVITAAANGISTIFGSLQNVDATKLLAIGPALIGIGVGLAALGAGGVINAIGSFLGGDPIKKIEALSASGDGLQNAAAGLQGVAIGLTQVATALAAIDTSKLEALSDFSTQMSIGSAVKGITDFITAPIKAVGETIGGEAGVTTPDNTAMITAINEVRDAVNKLYAKDTSINIDGKKVGTTLSQNSYKSA